MIKSKRRMFHTSTTTLTLKVITVRTGGDHFTAKLVLYTLHQKRVALNIL